MRAGDPEIRAEVLRLRRELVTALRRARRDESLALVGARIKRTRGETSKLLRLSEGIPSLKRVVLAAAAVGCVVEVCIRPLGALRPTGPDEADFVPPPVDV